MKKIFSMNRFEGWNLSLPLIQGGMGVGVSLSGLAGAVASEGGQNCAMQDPLTQGLHG